MSDNMNHRHRMAQYAERGSVELHTLLYFRGKKETEEAYITRVKENGFVVLIPKYVIQYFNTTLICCLGMVLRDLFLLPQAKTITHMSMMKMPTH